MAHTEPPRDNQIDPRSIPLSLSPPTGEALARNQMSPPGRSIAGRAIGKRLPRRLGLGLPDRPDRDYAPRPRPAHGLEPANVS